MSIEAKVESITPAQAKEMLKNNHSNRKVKERVAAAYRRDMEAGGWSMTGEPIQFSESGALLNGQHRLLALSWCTFVDHIDMLVVRGLPEKSNLLMDQGTPRTIADMLKMEEPDLKNVQVCAAIARWLTLAPVPDEEFMNHLKRKCPPAQALETYRGDSHGISRAAERGVHVRNVTPLPMSVSALGYCFFQFANLDIERTEQYFYAFTDLAFHDEGDPRKAAFNRIAKMLNDEEMKHGQMLVIATVSVLTRSWNMWRKGVQADTILVRSREGWIPPVKPV
jgi:hypothetical protein